MNALDRKTRQMWRVYADATAQHSPDRHCQRVVKLCDLLDTTLDTLKETVPQTVIISDTVDSCFNDGCLRRACTSRGLTPSPQALLPGELPVAIFSRSRAAAARQRPLHAQAQRLVVGFHIGIMPDNRCYVKDCFYIVAAALQVLEDVKALVPEPHKGHTGER